jgi:hypothetical protein
MSRSYEVADDHHTSEVSLEALEKVSGGTKANLKGAEKQLGNIIMDGLSFAGGALAGAGAAIFEGAVNAPSNPHQL